MYRDDYPTCEETYATLRIYKDQLKPDEISLRLALVPTDSQQKGDFTPVKKTAPVGGWFMSSKGKVESKDVQRHILWILDQLIDREALLKELQDEGYEMDVFCFWASAHGHGGPQLNHEIMQMLGSLGLTVGFDIYC